MLINNYECISLKWDTDYFGVDSARVNLGGIVDEKGQEDIIEFSRNYGFVTICNNGNINENNYWIGNRTNAFLTDINIQFIKNLADKPNCKNEKNEKAYVANCLHGSKQILNIARKSFNCSRFFNDFKLPEKEAKNIYVHWTECAFEQEDKFFVISEREGNIAGYILFSFVGDGSVIELIAVDDRYQGQKVGTSLIHKMEEFVMDRGIKNVKVGTQMNNIPAVLFYTKMGFRYVSLKSVYHLWRS